jgi:hypothetical protein
MSTEQAKDILTAQLYERYCTTSLVCDGVTAPSDLNIKPDLTDEEIKYFLMGLETGLFSIDDHSYAQSALLPKPSGKNTKQKMLPLFWRTGNKRAIFREGVCQLATASVLIYKFSWAEDEITMEPGIAEFGKYAYGVDILVRPRNSQYAICVEVKKNKSEFDKLVAGFESCCAIGLHSKDECAHSKNHPKYEFCLNVKPALLWLVAPGHQILYKLDYEDGGKIGCQRIHNDISKDRILALLSDENAVCSATVME